MHEYLQEIYKKVLEPHGAITVGEMVRLRTLTSLAPQAVDVSSI